MLKTLVCPICGEPIDDGDKTVTCDFCGVEMHAHCEVCMIDPTWEVFRRYRGADAWQMPEETFCLECYEVKVKIALGGCWGFLTPGFFAKQKVRYFRILDDWPNIKEEDRCTLTGRLKIAAQPLKTNTSVGWPNKADPPKKSICDTPLSNDTDTKS